MWKNLRTSPKSDIDCWNKFSHAFVACVCCCKPCSTNGPYLVNAAVAPVSRFRGAGIIIGHYPESQGLASIHSPVFSHGRQSLQEPAAVKAIGEAVTQPTRRWVPRRMPIQDPCRALQCYRASSASPTLCGNCRSLAKACFSICRTRSRLRPRTSPISWRLCGSYASRP